MFYPREYRNRDTDARIMLNHLESGREYPTEYIRDRVTELEEERSDRVRSYRDVRIVERELSFWRLLLSYRNTHTDPCDDCTNWIGGM